MSRAIVMTAYRRPEYFEQSLESWAAVRGVERWPMTIALEPSSETARMIEIAGRIMPQAEVKVNPQVFGVLVNPVEAIDRAMKAGHDYVLLAEEDVLVSDDVLEYHEWADESLHDDESILCVCSYSGNDSAPEDEIAGLDGFNPLIWGTWRDRWPLLYSTWDRDYSSGTGSTSGWDCNIQLRVMPKYGKRCVFPLASRAQHIGEHGGAHMTVAQFPDSQTASWAPSRPRQTYRLVSL